MSQDKKTFASFLTPRNKHWSLRGSFEVKWCWKKEVNQVHFCQIENMHFSWINSFNLNTKINNWLREWIFSHLIFHSKFKNPIFWKYFNRKNIQFWSKKWGTFCGSLTFFECMDWEYWAACMIEGKCCDATIELISERRVSQERYNPQNTDLQFRWYLLDSQWMKERCSL
jgi:hypothetical protein